MAWLNGSKTKKGACCVCIESHRKCSCVWTACRTTQITWITLSYLYGWVDYISRLAVTWQEHSRVLRSAENFWRWICLRDLIPGYDCLYIYISNSRLHSTSKDVSWTVSDLLCSWTCSGSFCVITVSTVQLQTVQFVQYLYIKCAVLLFSWTCNSNFSVITVSTVQLHTVPFVKYLYSKCAVLLCSWMWQALCRPLSSSRQQYMFTVWLLGWVGERQLQICVFYSLRIFLFVRQHLKTREVRNVSSISFLTQSNCGKNT